MTFLNMISEIQKEDVITAYLEKWAETAGDNPFFYYGEDNCLWSYKEFNQLVNRIAHSLQDIGVQKGDRISVFLRNSFVTTISMFAIWKAGGVFCPINFNFTGKLLAYQINDTKPAVVITEQGLLPAINEIKNDVEDLMFIIHEPQPTEHDFSAEMAEVRLDAKFDRVLFSQLLNGRTENPGLELHYADTANIIYTSGTTGASKGVVQPYRWINGYTFKRKLLAPQDTIYNDLPLYHVGGAFFNVARAAFVGCSVASWDKFSIHQFWDRIKVSGATVATLLDVMIPWLMKAEPKEDDRRNTLNKVHMQPLPKYHHQVAKRFAIDFVTVGFGQTESGAGISGLIHELDESEGTPSDLYKGYAREEIIEIARKYGMPVRDGSTDFKKGYMGASSLLVETAIFNEEDNPCKTGEIGQIVFRPRVPNLFLDEYFNKPEASLKAFRNLWFHTGDAGYQDVDGDYYFVDRMGDVIRSRGEKYSSYQLEDLINGYDKVDICAAFPIPAVEGHEDDAVVYIVIKHGEQLEVAELQQWLQQNAPKFMWPKHIRFINELPRTPTNKIEKYKLRNQILLELY